MSTVLAIDLGNESGRVVSVTFDGERVTAAERYRFANNPVTVRGTLHWDVLRLWHEIEQGLNCCKEDAVSGIGVASFGVDYGLLDRDGNLLGNPVHMRDTRTEDVLPWVFERISERALFERTGVGAHPINTLFQLASMVRDGSPQLDAAHTLLTMPNLINYWLTGEKLSEFTHTTTTQCYSPFKADWDNDLLNLLDIPTAMFPQVVPPGEHIGSYGHIPIYTVASHDTASAVVAVPTETANYAYISSGTWSLFGLEVPQPVTNEKALAAGLTNEGGYGGSYRMLSLIMGMWLVQECRRAWSNGNELIDYGTLFEIDDAPPFQSLINPDDPSLFTPGDMPFRIRELCAAHNEPVPQSQAAMVRCIMESLALKYDHVLAKQVEAAGQPVDVIHIVGGGAQNETLCQMTANATGRPVIAGPVEATALGNGLVQFIAQGEITDLAQAREVIRRSYPAKRYEPQDVAAWQTVKERFSRIVGE